MPASLITTVTVTFGTLGSVNLPVPDVGGWVSYGACLIIKFFVWCPYHTEYLTGLGNYFDDKQDYEPFATINELEEFYEENARIMESINPSLRDSPFSMNGTGGGPNDSIGGINDPDAPYVPVQAPANPTDLLFPDKNGVNGNPWFGGGINLQLSDPVEDTERTEYLSICVPGYGAYVGEGQADMACKLSWLITNTKFFVVMITLMDIVIILFIVIRYLPSAMKRFMKIIMDAMA